MTSEPPSDLPQQPAGSAPLLTPDERAERLASVISRKSLEGYIVIDRNEREATAVIALPGKPVNHTLHALISIFSCGIWVIPWIIMAMTQKKELRVRVSVDRFGNYSEEQLTIQ